MTPKRRRQRRAALIANTTNETLVNNLETTSVKEHDISEVENTKTLPNALITTTNADNIVTTETVENISTDNVNTTSATIEENSASVANFWCLNKGDI